MASNEWTAYHLTPDGWISGDKQEDSSPLRRRPAPADRILSVIYKETSSGFGPVYGSREEVWRSGDAVLIAELLEKFGTAPREL
jgi:hypothetical protein